MAVYVISRAGRPRAEKALEIAGHTVVFRRAWDAFGELCMAVVLDESHPVQGLLAKAPWKALFECYPKDPGLSFEDESAAVLAMAPARPAVSLANDPDPARQRALRSGWSAEDLIGAGAGGDAGSGGGRSPSTGLTLAEMALTQPPAEWAELRVAKRFPWDASSWKQPGPSWAPPSDLVKASQAKAVAEPDDEQGKPKAPPADPDPDPDTDETDPKVGGGDKPDKVPAPSPLELKHTLGEYGDAKACTGAVAILVALKQEANGTLPSRQKASYHLKKHHLPVPTKEQFEALLRTVPQPQV